MGGYPQRRNGATAERRPPAELAELRGFLARVGLASCLKDLARGPLNVRAASEHIVARTLRDASHHLKHFARPVDAALLHAAIADTEALAAGQLTTP